jgi:hypothetical protein
MGVQTPYIPKHSVSGNVSVSGSERRFRRTPILVGQPTVPRLATELCTFEEPLKDRAVFVHHESLLPKPEPGTQQAIIQKPREGGRGTLYLNKRIWK